MKRVISKTAALTVAFTLLAAPLALAGVVYDADDGTVVPNPTTVARNFHWIDWSEPGVIKSEPLESVSKQVANSEQKNAALKLTVGTRYEKEISPGYFLYGEVIALKPLMDNERNIGQTVYSQSKAGRTSPRTEINVVAKELDTRYSHYRLAGLPYSGMMAMGPDRDGGNVGLTMRFKAINNGKPVKPTIIVTDAEEAGTQEVEIFKTTGSGWKQVAEFATSKRPFGRWSTTQITLNGRVGDTYSWLSGGTIGVTTRLDDNGEPYSIQKWSGLKEQVNSAGRKEYVLDPDRHPDINPGKSGLGKSAIGPLFTDRISGTVPILATSATSYEGVDVSFYVNSSGIQDVMFGAMLPETGDAPESYGEAIHLMPKEQSSYLGRQFPDIDPVELEKSVLKPWNNDDTVDLADEGIAQLHADGATDFQAADRFNPYTLPIYVTVRSAQTRVIGWVDFNNNGTFDAEESSGIVPVDATGKVNLEFTETSTIPYCTEKLGVRVRLVDENDVKNPTPTSTAFSGEVEDFQIPAICPPKGSKETTEGPQNQPQSIKVNFTAQGKLRNDGQTNASIDANQAVKIVTSSGSLVTSWTEPNQGTYTVTADGTVTFQPLPSFVGAAKGVVLRAVDTNGLSSGWTPIEADNLTAINEGVNGATTMDGVYIPTVTPLPLEPHHVVSEDVQGRDQENTPTFSRNGDPVTPTADRPAKLIDPATGQVTTKRTVDAMKNGERIGTYTITPRTGKVVFSPNPDFVGEAEPAKVVVTDEHGQTATGLYTPTVTPLPLEPRHVVSEDVQGRDQENTPTFSRNGDPVTPTADRPAKLIDPATGQETDNVTVDAMKNGKRIGTYTITPGTGKVVFSPNPDFIGEAEPAKVVVTDEYGQSATGKYTPTVTPLPLVPQNVSSIDIQGTTQTGTPTFTRNNVPVTPTADRPAKLIDPVTGQPTAELSIPALNEGGKQIGTYTVEPLTGKITFTPNKNEKDTPQPAVIEITDEVGQKARGVYTPTVVPV
ncbi:hypothetical protein HMPREF0044_0635, partial [Gleimia coleocanis DSM 15436]